MEPNAMETPTIHGKTKWKNAKDVRYSNGFLKLKKEVEYNG
jgi:hypothetical protein